MKRAHSMDTKHHRSSRRLPAEQCDPASFGWFDIYPLIGLVGLAGYLILG
jgi:hypothetical protein